MIVEHAAARRSFGVTALAVHGLIESVDDARLGDKINRIDMIVPDGQPVVWALNLFHRLGIRFKIPGPTLTLEVLRRANERGLSVYLFGSTADTLARFRAHIETEYPNLSVAGVHEDRFREATAEEDAADVAKIRASGAHIVLVGRGCPRQEHWVADHVGRVDAAMLAVGAAFDYHAGKLARAPDVGAARGARVGLSPRPGAAQALAALPRHQLPLPLRARCATSSCSDTRDPPKIFPESVREQASRHRRRRADRQRGRRTAFVGRGWTRARRGQQHARRLLRPEGATRPGTRVAWSSATSTTSASTPTSATAPGWRRIVADFAPDAVVHTAAQPSHDLAASRPFDDFDVNAVGTLNLLEAVRRYRTDVPFVHLSTNKVYGDRPNTLELVERETRWDFADPAFANGIAEDFPIDQSKHSVFGASKVAADVMVQEYGRYFDMPTCCLRGGCLTGPNHSGVELHGFVSYLIRCNLERARGTPSSATAASRCATTSTATTWPPSSPPSSMRPAWPRSTTWAEGTTTRSRSWRPSS